MYVLVKIRRERKMTDNARRIEGTTIRGPTGNLTISCPDEESITRKGTKGYSRRLDPKKNTEVYGETQSYYIASGVAYLGSSG